MNASSAASFSSGSVTACRRPQHDDGPVVHRVLEHGPREHDAVEQRHRETGGNACAELLQRPARRRAVNVDVVVETCMECGDREGLILVDEARDERRARVEHCVDRVAFVLRPLVDAPDTRPRRRSGVRASRAIEPKPTDGTRGIARLRRRESACAGIVARRFDRSTPRRTMIRKLTMVATLVAAALVLVTPAMSAPTATVVNVTAGKPSELKFTMSKKSVAKGTVTFKVVNKGALEHDFKIGGQEDRPAQEGQERDADRHAQGRQGRVHLHRAGSRGRRHEGNDHGQVVRGVRVGTAQVVPTPRQPPRRPVQTSHERGRFVAGHDRSGVPLDPRPGDASAGRVRATRDPRGPGPAPLLVGLGVRAIRRRVGWARRAECATTVSPLRGSTTRAGEIGAIVHDPRLLETPGFTESFVPLIRIAMERDRLHRDLVSKLDQLKASRLRIVEAGDEERQRLERNLHDGAQQRLTAALIPMRSLATKLDAAPELRPLARAAIEDLAGAIDDLRELARGLHPPLLAREGLGAALRAGAMRSALPVELDLELPRRLPSAARGCRVLHRRRGGDQHGQARACLLRVGQRRRGRRHADGRRPGRRDRRGLHRLRRRIDRTRRSRRPRRGARRRARGGQPGGRQGRASPRRSRSASRSPMTDGATDAALDDPDAR